MVFVKVQADVLEYIGTGHGQDREYGGWHVLSFDEKLEDQGYFGKVVWTTWFSVFWRGTTHFQPMFNLRGGDRVSPICNRTCSTSWSFLWLDWCVNVCYPNLPKYDWTNAVEPDLAIAAWSFGTCGWHWHCLSRVVRDSKPPTQPSCGQWCDFGSKLFEPQIAIDAVRATRNGELEGFVLYSIEHHGRPSHLGTARELHAR